MGKIYSLVRTYTPRWITHKLEGFHACKTLPEDLVVHAPQGDPHPRGPKIWRQALSTFGFENQWNLYLGDIKKKKL